VDSKTTEDSVRQPKRHFIPSERTVLGIESDSSEEQSENEHPGISTRRDPDSNVTDESDLQSEKQPHPKISTDEGIQIDLREKHSKNPLSPIRLSCDTGVNVIAKSKLPFIKQLSPSHLIDEGMENDVRERSVISLSVIVVTSLSTDETGAEESVIQGPDGCAEGRARLADNRKTIELDPKSMVPLK
jgi:hypothetical protein